MSILQEYEQIRKEIGYKKYDAINVYLNERCSKENRIKYQKELSMLDYQNPDEWINQKIKLEEKYQIINLSDVLYTRKEWENFEKWYEKNKDNLCLNKNKERGNR